MGSFLLFIEEIVVIGPEDNVVKDDFDDIGR